MSENTYETLFVWAMVASMVLASCALLGCDAKEARLPAPSVEYVKLLNLDRTEADFYVAGDALACEATGRFLYSDAKVDTSASFNGAAPVLSTGKGVVLTKAASSGPMTCVLTMTHQVTGSVTSDARVLESYNSLREWKESVCGAPPPARCGLPTCDCQ